MFGSGNGLFGLGDTGFGRFVNRASETVGGALESGAEFIARLPNELIETGENLGNSIFGGGRTQDEFVDQGREFQARRAGGSIGSLINNNFETIALFGALLAAVAIFSNK